MRTMKKLKDQPFADTPVEGYKKPNLRAIEGGKKRQFGRALNYDELALANSTYEQAKHQIKEHAIEEGFLEVDFEVTAFEPEDSAKHYRNKERANRSQRRHRTFASKHAWRRNESEAYKDRDDSYADFYQNGGCFTWWEVQNPSKSELTRKLDGKPQADGGEGRKFYLHRQARWEREVYMEYLREQAEADSLARQELLDEIQQRSDERTDALLIGHARAARARNI